MAIKLYICERYGSSLTIDYQSVRCFLLQNDEYRNTLQHELVEYLKNKVEVNKERWSAVCSSLDCILSFYKHKTGIAIIYHLPDTQEALIWRYTIGGKDGGNCEIQADNIIHMFEKKDINPILTLV